MIACLLGALAMGACAGSAAWEKPAHNGLAGLGQISAEKPKKGEQAFAVIAGTVFREPGFALPGAEVRLAPDPSARPKPKLKQDRSKSDSRGEFAFRVPPGPMRYTVSVSANGFEPQTREVNIQAEERVDVFFQLGPKAR